MKLLHWAQQSSGILLVALTKSRQGDVQEIRNLKAESCPCPNFCQLLEIATPGTRRSKPFLVICGKSYRRVTWKTNCCNPWISACLKSSTFWHKNGDYPNFLDQPSICYFLGFKLKKLNFAQTWASCHQISTICSHRIRRQYVLFICFSFDRR